MKFILSTDNIPTDIIDRVGDKCLAAILWNRGYTSLSRVEEFLDSDKLASYQAEDIPSIVRAAESIASDIEKDHKIAVYGDYDVDGVTSTALLVRTLRAAGADVIYHVPHRFTEGYGMNSERIRILADTGCQTILTCDCGISNYDEITLAKELGLKVIVTDHHNIPQPLVPADIVVNPKMLNENHPLHSLPGVGVAYLLASILQKLVGFDLPFDPLQLVALGIVSDVVPLKKANRHLLRKGLEVLNSNKRIPGIEALMKVSRLKYIDEDVIGFQLGPRLNAPGRVESAELSVELLLSDDRKQAAALASQIDSLNIERKLLVSKVLSEFEGFAPKDGIVQYNPGWHEGVIGIAAGRLCEIHQVPVILLTLKDDGITVTGSARSVDDINIFDVLDSVGDTLDRFGGHAKAAGLATKLDKLDLFLDAVTKQFSGYTRTSESTVVVDCEISINEVDLSFYKSLRALAPFGEEFPRPVFCSKDVEVYAHQIIGDGKHLKLQLKSSNNSLISAILWNSVVQCPDKSQVDVYYGIGTNTMNGTTELQLELIGLESGQKATLAPITVEDRRYLPGSPFPSIDMTTGGVFLEGKQGDKGEYDRYSIEPCETLILQSIPPNLNILRAIVKQSSCARVVLAYPSELTDPPSIINRVMGILKGHFTRKNFELSLRELSIQCEETESTVIAVLLLLQSNGYLALDSMGDNLKVQPLPGQKINKNSRFYSLAQAAEAESKVFKKWMTYINAGELTSIIK
ncbi:MAG: single-stranded-DNA-specific exonuclease RecJ [Acidobacteriota bacterium]